MNDKTISLTKKIHGGLRCKENILYILFTFFNNLCRNVHWCINLHYDQVICSEYFFKCKVICIAFQLTIITQYVISLHKCMRNEVSIIEHPFFVLYLYFYFFV